MATAALYGLLLGVTIQVFTKTFPQPLGSITLWTLLTMQLTWGAVICWRRTGLPYATAAMAVGAVICSYLAILAATGRVLPHLSTPWWIPLAVSFVSSPILFFLESRRNPAKWKAWGAYMERTTLWDMLRGRHIPQLRDSRA
jgi:hypothetical protein